MAHPHFQELSRKLFKLWEEGFLLDAEILASNKVVHLHKIILAIFSSHIAEQNKAVDGVWCVNAPGCHSEDIGNLVRFLYDSEISIGDKCTETIRSLRLDLCVDQKIRKQKVSKSKEEQVQTSINFELKLLRNLTFQLGLPKLLHEHKRLADVKIRTGKQVHKCHKIILSSVSEFFAAMFSSGMKETLNDVIHLQGIETETFSSILSYIYLGKNPVSADNVQDLLSTAVYLQMNKLQLLCEDYLLDHMDIKNCVDIRQFAEVHNCINLVTGALHFVSKNFREINKLKLVRNLKFNDVVQLITDDNLNVSSENEVLSFVLEWLANNQSGDSDVLLHHVRLELVDKKYLEKVLEENKLMKTQPVCASLIREAIQQVTDKTTARPRKEETFIVLKRSSSSAGIEVVCYSTFQKAWFQLESFPHTAGGTGFSACSTDDCIYLSGGSATPKCLYKFSVEENKWTELADMNEGRYTHATGCVKDKLYVLGGSTISGGAFDAVSSIEKYDIELNKWVKVCNMAIATFDSAYAVVRTQILVFGGSIASMCGVYLKDIQCFDTVTETCTTLYYNLPFPLSLATACVHNRDIYLTCPNGKIIHYGGNMPPSVIYQAKTTHLMGFATIYHNSAIYILGGYSAIGESDGIQKFDLKMMKQTVFRETKVPFAKQTNQLYAAVMFVSRKYLN